MTVKFLVPLAFCALFLAACDSAPDAPATDAAAPQDDGTTTIEIEVPDALMPAIDAFQNPEAALDQLRGHMDDLRAQASTMSEEAKREAVIAARNTAEGAATALGQTDAEIQAAGDTAEANAREALGL
jgi:hypothetical protein